MGSRPHGSRPGTFETLIAGVILAAGGSARLGSTKQLLPLEGRPLLQHVIDTAAAADLNPIVIVLGYRATEIEAALELPGPAHIVLNPDYTKGQATSLRAGLSGLATDVRAAVILLGDQPGIATGAIREAVAVYERTKGPAVRSFYRGRPGHPVVLDRAVWPALMTETGDRGARELLAEHPDWVVRFERDEEPPADVDTQEDYDRLIL